MKHQLPNVQSEDAREAFCVVMSRKCPQICLSVSAETESSMHCGFFHFVINVYFYMQYVAQRCIAQTCIQPGLPCKIYFDLSGPSWLNKGIINK